MVIVPKSEVAYGFVGCFQPSSEREWKISLYSQVRITDLSKLAFLKP